MLSKLMKYELRATARYFLPIYGAIIVFSMLIGIRGVNDTYRNILSVILPMALGLSFMGLGVMTLIMVVKRFDSNLLGDEGYLMFTLPVKSQSIILSKLLTSMIWILSSALVFFLSMGIITWKEFNLREILEELSNLQLDPYFLVVFVLVILMSIIQFLLQVYASLGIAQAYSISKSRILGGTLIFILFSIVINMVETLAAAGFTFLFGDSQWFHDLVQRAESNDFITVFSTIQLFFTILLGYLILKNILFYFLTKYHLQKKLNLE
ncbi:hypothetical protein J3A84_04275 [Proteiniclasticum sp. SCR006]|uniref:Uncharacterized protein n=1 Tax=Proteiniclasticum aestuarii TaxID=2817862 RepID=A0A939H6Y1_9CLOT|nr:hypothetical protein [Proteiniclasticum aestuarii]MBO1264261.1 hypothetical protein [Proteiniclasticum aestuarii]